MFEELIKVVVLLSWLLLAGFGGVFSAQAASDIGLTEAEQGWLQAHPKISIGIMDAWPPMDYVDHQGKPRGIGVQFIKALNQRLGGRLEIVAGDWQGNYDAVRGKRLDALMDITPRPDREVDFLFTTPYLEVPHVIFTRRDGPHRASLAELAGQTVAVEHGFFIAKVLKQNYPQVTVREYPSTSDALDALVNTEVDAYVGNRAVAMYIIENELISNLKAAGKITETASINAIGVRKDWPILRDILQKALDDISAQERSELISPSAWLAGQEASAKSTAELLDAADRLWLAEHAPLQVGVMDSWPPFNFVDEQGNSRGIGMDYLAALNKRLGNVLSPVPGEWKRIYDDVANKRLDLIMDITPKPERESLFNFTRPYVEVPHVIVALREGAQLESEQSLEGKTLALEKGFGNVRYFQKNYPGVKLKLFANTLSALEAVSRGDADAYAGNRVVALYLMDKHFITNLRVHGRLSKPASSLALGVRKDWPRLRDILQRALDDMAPYERHAIVSRWVRPGNGHSYETALTLTAEEQAWLREHPEIPIGVDGNWPPIDFFNEQGEHVGITAEYLHLLERQLDVHFVPLRSEKFKDMLRKVMDGTLKVGASISYRKERAEKLYFSKPFYHVHKVIIAAKGTHDIRRAKDLHGRRVAVEDGFLTMRQLQELHPQIELVPVESTLRALQMVSWGEADAYVGNQAVAGWLQRKHQLSNLRIVGDPGLGTGPQNFVVSKNAPDWEPLIGIIDKALDNITEEERLAIEQRWLGHYLAESKLPRVILTEAEERWLKEHRSIRLGVDIAWEPLEFLAEDGEYKGLSADYMRLFAEQLGINWIEPKRISWSEVLKGLKDKTLDVAPLISRTPEREVFLNYTQPYLDFPTVIFNRRESELISGLEDLNGRNVAAVEGYSLNASLRDEHPRIHLHLYPGVAEALRAVSIGEQDAFVGSLAVGSYLVGKEGFNNLQVAAPTPYDYRFGIGVRKDWPELVGILDKAIDTIDEERRNEIFRRWTTVRYQQQIDYTLLWQVLAGAMLVLLLASIWVGQVRRSNRALHESRERLAMTLKSAELGAWEARLGKDGALHLSLDETFHRHHGLPADLHRPDLSDIYACIDEEDIEPVRSDIEHFLSSREASVAFEYKVRGQERWLNSQGHTLERDTEGHPSYIVGISRDVTTSRLANEALKQASRFKSEFLANMSHEIRTPMNAIIGLGHLLSRTRLDEKQRDYVHKTQVSAQSLLGLIDDILDFSKIEAGRLSVESVPFEFESLFENLSIMTSTRIGDSPIEFLYDFAPQVPERLVGDPYRIGQVLNNLVSNAIKFTEQGSVVVRVKVLEKDRHQVRLYFEVEDSGIGIEPQRLGSLFDPFTQADGSTTRRFGGTGLGLSICQKLCALMGGSIGADSRPGEGSRFYFELPLRYIGTPELPRPAPDLRGLQVLLVDDSPMARSVIGDMLESMTFRTSIRASGGEALNCLQKADTHFDLVLIDWRMPDMDGYETANRIAELLGAARPIVLITTAYGREILEQDADATNVDGYLVKPLTPSLVFDAVVRAYDARETGATAADAVAEVSLLHNLRGRILLVEDNAINQQVAKELLEQMGLAVDTVSDGRQAVDYVAGQAPDLVLMDIQMPVMDGYEATRQIRAMPNRADLPIYAMTANALVGDAEKSLDAGMDGHINKPINPEELYRALSEYLPAGDVLPEPQAERREGGWQPPTHAPACLDVQSGIAQIGGSPDFYLKLLRDFVANHGDCNTQLQGMLEKSRFEDARRLVHTLKSVGNNIGARRFGRSAMLLEQQLTSAGPPPEGMLSEFSDACDELFAALEEMIPPVIETHTATDERESRVAEEAGDALQGLLKSLAEGKADSVAMFAGLGDPLRSLLSEQQYEQLAELIGDYEFEQATELLYEAMKGESYGAE